MQIKKLILAVGFCIVSTACIAADLIQVTPEKWKAIAATPVGTMKTADYLGVKDGKAYVVLNEMSLINSKEWKKTTYWVEANKLDAQYLATLTVKK